MARGAWKRGLRGRGDRRAGRHDEHNPTADGTWSAGTLNSAGLAAINKTGKTQIRQYLTTDDNNNGVADYMGCYSGESSSKPQLTVIYTEGAANQPSAFTADPMSRANVTAGAAYTGQTLAGSATDVDAGATQISGPAWLIVAANGALSGTPASTNAGLNSWTVQVSDGTATDTAVLNITVAAPSAPAFAAAGAVAGGTGTITPALPAGRATGDILLLFVETANQACSISNPNGGTWTEVTPAQGTGTAAATTATRLTAFWSRYNGTQGAPAVSDSGDHQTARVIAIRGAAASGNPWDVTAGGVEATADTSGSIPGATTTVANTLSAAVKGMMSIAIKN